MEEEDKARHIEKQVYKNKFCEVIIILWPDINLIWPNKDKVYGNHTEILYPRISTGTYVFGTSFAIVVLRALGKTKDAHSDALFLQAVAHGDITIKCHTSGRWWWKKYKDSTTSHNQRLELVLTQAIKHADHYQQSIELASDMIVEVKKIRGAIDDAKQLINEHDETGSKQLVSCASV